MRKTKNPNHIKEGTFFQVREQEEGFHIAKVLGCAAAKPKMG